MNFFRSDGFPWYPELAGPLQSFAFVCFQGIHTTRGVSLLGSRMKSQWFCRSLCCNLRPILQRVLFFHDLVLASPCSHTHTHARPDTGTSTRTRTHTQTYTQTHTPTRMVADSASLSLSHTHTFRAVARLGWQLAACSLQLAGWLVFSQYRAEHARDASNSVTYFTGVHFFLLAFAWPGPAYRLAGRANLERGGGVGAWAQTGDSGSRLEGGGVAWGQSPTSCWLQGRLWGIQILLLNRGLRSYQEVCKDMAAYLLLFWGPYESTDSWGHPFVCIFAGSRWG